MIAAVVFGCKPSRIIGVTKHAVKIDHAVELTLMCGSSR